MTARAGRVAPGWLARAVGGCGAFVIGLLVLPAVAAAHEAADDPPKRNAISYKPLAILSRGLVVQYERLLEPVSIVAGSGLRAAARDDFSSVTWLTHTEGRWWFLGEEPITDTPGMGGLYLGVGFNVARTELESDSLGRSIGVDWTLEESLRFGYRFVLFGLQEITPSIVGAIVHDFDEDGRLAPTTRPTFGFDLTVGWLF